ncbi:hypothetical protein PG996_005749 [Apiospora saccharicola]|uniref:Uncharacterized protein n=1 Tax=Apiospora saccharicola TaxID=335842 RepID=A0ABR1VMC9_9PEZI
MLYNHHQKELPFTTSYDCHHGSDQDGRGVTRDSLPRISPPNQQSAKLQIDDDYFLERPASNHGEMRVIGHGQLMKQTLGMTPIPPGASRQKIHRALRKTSATSKYLTCTPILFAPSYTVDLHSYTLCAFLYGRFADDIWIGAAAAAFGWARSSEVRIPQGT